MSLHSGELTKSLNSALVSVAKTSYLPWNFCSQEWLSYPSLTPLAWGKPRWTRQWSFIIRPWGNHGVQESLLDQNSFPKGCCGTEERFLLEGRKDRRVSPTEMNTFALLSDTSHHKLYWTSVMWFCAKYFCQSPHRASAIRQGILKSYSASPSCFLFLSYNSRTSSSSTSQEWDMGTIGVA